MTKRSPFRYFKTSPEIIRLAVMMYVRFPLSLRNVEDLPPGIRTFEVSSGIADNAWQGKFWARWSDAFKEAGFEPNTVQERYSTNFLLSLYYEAARKFGKAPTKAEFSIFARNREDCPATVGLASPSSCLYCRFHASVFNSFNQEQSLSKRDHFPHSTTAALSG